MSVRVVCVRILRTWCACVHACVRVRGVGVCVRACVYVVWVCACVCVRGVRVCAPVWCACMRVFFQQGILFLDCDWTGDGPSGLRNHVDLVDPEMELFFVGGGVPRAREGCGRGSEREHEAETSLTPKQCPVIQTVHFYRKSEQNCLPHNMGTNSFSRTSEEGATGLRISSTCHFIT